MEQDFCKVWISNLRESRGWHSVMEGEGAGEVVEEQEDVNSCWEHTEEQINGPLHGGRGRTPETGIKENVLGRGGRAFKLCKGRERNDF